FDPNADGALSVAGSMKRKYPPWGVTALCKSEVRKKLHIIGDQNASRYIPCHNEIRIEQKAFSMPYEDLRRLYLQHKVYLNLSGSEGFGLTVYEAMKYGEIVVSPRLPAFEGLLDDADVMWVPVEGVGELDPWPYEYIEIFKYNGDALMEAAAKALEMSVEEREKIWCRNLHALQRTVGRSYDKLIKILHEE
ncbi:MAG: glycosyltransferase, partial [Thermoproteus sp.]|nr:glycosyltransferase [Thermoproteus sp.]